MQPRLHSAGADAQHLRDLTRGQVQNVIEVEQKPVVVGEPFDLRAQVDTARDISLARLALDRLRESQHGPPPLAAGHAALVRYDRQEPRPNGAQLGPDAVAVAPSLERHLLDRVLGGSTLAE